MAAAANPVAAVGFALVAALVTAVTNDALDDKIASSAGTDLSVTNLSDTWGAFKLQMLEGIDLSHSATFSNGFVDSVAGPKVSYSPSFPLKSNSGFCSPCDADERLASGRRILRHRCATSLRDV